MIGLRIKISIKTPSVYMKGMKEYFIHLKSSDHDDSTSLFPICSLQVIQLPFSS